MYVELALAIALTILLDVSAYFISTVVGYILFASVVS